MKIWGRGPYGAITVLGSVAALAFAALFLWLRVSSVSEPAVIATDDWQWSSAGVAVRSIDQGPFDSGDIVAGIDGRSLEAWAATGRATVPGGTDGLPPVLRFDLLRDGHPVTVSVHLERPSLVGLLSNGIGLLIFTSAQLAVAALAFLRRWREGWRRGFLIGSVANLASALVWEIGLQPTDLVRSEPMLLLFALTAPLHLLFWSSVIHVVGSFPLRRDLFAGRPGLVAAVYGAPQIALAVGISIARVVAPTTLDWIALWARILALVILGALTVTIGMVARAYRRFGLDERRQFLFLFVAIVATAVAVLGLTVVPVIAVGRPLASRSAVAALGLPVIGALLISIVRYRLFEIAIVDRSRRRLVIAREEERRRIRRDLHDGLGPLLAALTLKVDVARDQVRSDPSAAEASLDDLRADTQVAVAQVRRLVREMRPPNLDELGLVEALRERADALCAAARGETPDFDIRVEAASDLPPLNAGVEVAAYRIVTEAMTNVIRHARASQCVVRIFARGELELEVLDDGIGVDPARPAGVGFASMRERAAELGGTWSIDRTPQGWTRVASRLPLTA